MEIWKDVPGFEGFHQVSTYGRVRSVDRYYYRNGGKVWLTGRVLKPRKYKGYLMVTVSKEGRQERRLVSRLVAETFVPNPENKPQVNHNDENKENNRPDNLSWMTPKENSNWGTRNARISKYQTDNPMAKIGFGRRRKPVNQLDKNTKEVIRRYESVKEALFVMGVKPNNGGISSCLRKDGSRNSFRGYDWEYAD